MVERGVLREREGRGLRLIDGELVVAPPQGPEHSSATEVLDSLLRRAYGEAYRVRTAMPLDVSDPHTLPEPNLVVVRGDPWAFRERHPFGYETSLVIEVAHTSVGAASVGHDAGYAGHRGFQGAHGRPVLHFASMSEAALLEMAVAGSDDALLALGAAHPTLRIEREASGALRVMSPTGSETGNKNFNLAVIVGTWIRANGLGRGFDSSTGFTLPNGAVKSADLAWVRNERWDALTLEERTKFAPICPDFVLELRSPSDKLDELQDKLAEFIANGAQLGWLIDPFERKVHVYRPGVEPVELVEATSVDGDPVLPGFVLHLAEIWGS